MSTGDQSEYLRRKMAERRTQYDQGGQFMKSGYQLWAENERPARQGGAMKEAGERESTKAGKDILDRVKSLGEDMFAKYYKGSARHHEGDSESDEEMEGGRAMGVVQAHGGGYSGNAMPVVTNGMVDAPKKKRVYKKKVVAVVEVPMVEEKKATKKVMKEAKTTGKGKMECVHHEEGEGTVVKKGKGKLVEHGADLIKMGKAEEKEGGASKRSARAAIVKKVMKDKGLSLPAASKYVKEHGLYKA